MIFTLYTTILSPQLWRLAVQDPTSTQCESATEETLRSRLTFSRWREYVPHQATKHKFLMHGLLALSALHIAYVKPEEALKYARLSDKHQAIALAKYRSILASDIDMDSADALFAFAATINLTTMARACSPAISGFATTISIDSALELFHLTRGCRDIIEVCGQHIRTGPMSEMLQGHGSDNHLAVTLPESVGVRFEELRAMLLDFMFADRVHLEACREALTGLEIVFKKIVYLAQGSPVEGSQIWAWTAMISSGFLRLIQDRNGPALIIMSHYAAATMAIQTSWYSENWGVYCVRGIEVELEPQYLHWLEWPREHASRHMSILGVAVQPDDRSRPLIAY